jgi:hypothetical protein
MVELLEEVSGFDGRVWAKQKPNYGPLPVACVSLPAPRGPWAIQLLSSPAVARVHTLLSVLPHTTRLSTHPSLYHPPRRVPAFLTWQDEVCVSTQQPCCYPRFGAMAHHPRHLMLILSSCLVQCVLETILLAIMSHRPTNICRVL